MAQPSRNASSENILNARRVFFCDDENEHGTAAVAVGTQCGTADRRIALPRCRNEFQLHDFVIMPDHVHLLLELDCMMTIEKAMQLVKGRFSYRLKKEQGYEGEVWQRGFSEVQVMDARGMEKCRDYIATNPLKAGLVASADKYPFCFRYRRTETLRRRG